MFSLEPARSVSLIRQGCPDMASGHGMLEGGWEKDISRKKDNERRLTEISEWILVLFILSQYLELFL